MILDRLSNLITSCATGRDSSEVTAIHLRSAIADTAHVAASHLDAETETNLKTAEQYAKSGSPLCASTPADKALTMVLTSLVQH